MGNLGFGEIVAIVVVVLLVFGAKRIPELMRSLGRGVQEFKKGMTDLPEDHHHDHDKDKPAQG